ncbi:unnamed protein product, partial [Brenthis ino]
MSYKLDIILDHLKNISALNSDGDRSPFYQTCVKNCKKANCTLDGEFLPKAAEMQDTWSRLLFWGCRDECRYNCMWRTVSGFQERGYDIPKFHGRWPFRRLFGIQEPASAFASLLNLAMHMYMYFDMYQDLPMKRIPILVPFWHIFAILCMNAWVWSAIFHTRDFFFTEFMDYACATSVIMAMFLSSLVRVTYKQKRFTLFLVSSTLLFYADYVLYLYQGKTDYEYNMRTNIVFGVLGSLLWVSWGAYQIVKYKYYVWRIFAFLFLTLVTLSLEIFDFPPIYGWDAHALWHLSTAPLPVLLYRFVVDDIKQVQKEEFDKMA